MDAAPDGSAAVGGVAGGFPAAATGQGARKAGELLLANLVLFSLYRAAFVAAFARSPQVSDVLAVLAWGLRLDLTLLGIEASLVALVALLVPRWRSRGALTLAWVLTGVNLVIVVTNLLFFHERSQPLWEMLLAHVDRLSQVGVAIEPFAVAHPVVVAGLLASPFLVGLAARRHLRGLPESTRTHAARFERAPAVTFLLLVVLTVAVASERTTTKMAESGTRIRMVSAKRHMRFTDYALNQAVVNPVLDLGHFYLPSRLATPRYRLEPDDAIRRATALLGLSPADERFPLLRRIAGDPGLGIRNVVLVQVEGLGSSLLEREVNGRPLMPFLRELGTTGLLFPNVYQSFCATDGAVFATTTSLHRAFADRETKSHFFPYEYSGRHGSLPRVLGDRERRHLFFAGFRQRIDEFVSFASNQGFVAYGYEELVPRLGDRASTASSTLGIYDDVLFDEVARELASVPGAFDVQVMTGTSHSPWEVPGWFDRGDVPEELATFAYLDASVARFVARLHAERADFDATLFVFTGDHTSLTSSGEIGERLRVPLIFYSTEIVRQRERWSARQGNRASHVDVLPTILSLVGGEHPYAGMGRSILTEPSSAAGIVSSAHHESFYLQGDYALRYTSHDGEAELLRVEGDRFGPEDLAAEEPELVKRLEGEYLALYEAASRLAHEGRVFPRQ